MTEQNFTAWLADNKAELKDIIGAARAGFAGGYAAALEQIGAGGVGDVSPVHAEPPQTEERAAFEAWVAGFDSGSSLIRDDDGYYDDWNVQRAWAGWQARAALSSRPVQGGELSALVVGSLPTMNQDPYPALGAWWVQLWGESGDDSRVIARAYGDSPEQATQRAEQIAAALSSAPAREPMTDEQVYDLNWPADVGGFDDVREIVRQVERHHGICKE